MLRDFYLKVANEMMDLADERLKEASDFTEKAKHYIEMAEDQPQEEIMQCIKDIKNDCKILNKTMAKNLGWTLGTFNENFYKTKHSVSFSKITRYCEAAGLDLVIFDPKGNAHRIKKKEWKINKNNPFVNKKYQKKDFKESPEMWFSNDAFKRT